MNERSTLDRRRLLVLALSLAAPRAAARQDAKREPAVTIEDATALRAAWDQARERSRPLLVMLLREAKDIERGELWGACLGSHVDELAIGIGLCDLVLASAAQVRTLWPDAFVDGEEPPFGLVVLAEGETVRRVALKLPSPCPLHPADDAERERVSACHKVLAKSLADVVWPDDATFDRRAACVVPKGLRDLDRRRMRFFVAAHAESALRYAPTGSKWAHRTPSGVIVLDDEPDPLAGCSGGPCGTGHVPTPSRAFLVLYSCAKAGR